MCLPKVPFTTLKSRVKASFKRKPGIKQEIQKAEESLTTRAILTIPEKPLFTPRRLRVVCVGAGFSGLILAYRHKYQLEADYIDLKIYDKNSGVGGTWFENHYPGVSCDVPAHCYSFPFAPNSSWSKFYAGGAEILAYIQAVTERFDLDEHVQLNSEVISATWSESESKWVIEVQHDGRIHIDKADVFINGSGVLNRWKWPKVPGLDDFKGKLVHTAAWDQSLDCRGKRIALIGNGSSAIQVLPKMQPDAKELTTYIRTPTWITGGMLGQLTPAGTNFEFSEKQKTVFQEDPAKFGKYRKMLEHNLNEMFQIYMKDSPVQTFVTGVTLDMMQKALGNNPEMCERLIPDFPIGCRRITPGDGYLEALQQPNVDIVYDDILRFTKTGIVTTPKTSTASNMNPTAITNGGSVSGEKDFDIIICATGFDVSFIPSWKMYGRKGVSLNQLWRDNPEGYLGICAPEMPNYFVFTGPNSPLGHGSHQIVLDVTAEYIFKCCWKLASQDYRSMCVKSSAVRDYTDHADKWNTTKSVWSADCPSWYKSNKSTTGRVTAMYPGSAVHYRECLKVFRAEDFDWETLAQHGGNKFSFMGCGFTAREVQRSGDLGYYLEEYAMEREKVKMQMEKIRQGRREGKEDGDDQAATTTAAGAGRKNSHNSGRSDSGVGSEDGGTEGKVI